MTKDKILNTTANAGEILVIIAAAIWLTGWEGTKYVFALGTILFATGRFLESHPDSQTITLKRLYVQRNIGVVMLILAAVLMFTFQYINGYEIQDYVVRATPTAWLLPFMIFVVLELYTAFRIPSEIKKNKQ